MPEFTSPRDDAPLEEAARLGRESLDAALSRFTSEQRDAFWKAIGLYYSTRRHPGADEARDEAPAA